MAISARDHVELLRVIKIEIARKLTKNIEKLTQLAQKRRTDPQGAIHKWDPKEREEDCY